MEKSEINAGNGDMEKLVQWFTERLSHERRCIEASHASLLEEFRQQLETTDFAQEDAEDIPYTNNAGSAIASGKLGSGQQDVYACSAIESGGFGSSTQEVYPSETKKAKNVTRMLSFSGRAQIIATSPEDTFRHLVLSRRFEWFFIIMIALNIVVMALESQYLGLGVGHDIGYPKYNRSKESIWPPAKLLFTIADYFFGGVYTIELILKVIGLRHDFLDRWNFLDTFIVLAWYSDRLISQIHVPVDSRILRVLRLVRLLRLAQLASIISHFEQLYLMVTALRQSLMMLGWTAVLLMSCQVTFAFIMNQILVSYVIESEEVSMEIRKECFLYFGNFSRSYFSMFELTLGNWIPIARFLVDDVAEYFIIFAIIYKLTFGFAVIAVINGCFIKETFKAAEADDHLMIIQKDKDRKLHHSKMMKLLSHADMKGDGSLTKEEFHAICQVPAVNKWLGAQGLRVTDANAIFTLINDDGGEVSKEQLVKGTNLLKGPARSLDLAFERKAAVDREERVLAEVQQIHKQVTHALRREFAGHARSTQASTAQPSSSAASETPSTLIASDLKEELSQLAKELADVKNALRANNVLREQSSTTRQQASGDAQAAATHPSSLMKQPSVVNLRQSPNQKILDWGCVA